MTKNWCLLGFILAAAVMAGLCLCAQAKEANMVWDGKSWVKAAPPAPGSAEGDLLNIRSLIEEGRYKKAVKAVDKFLILHSASPACEEAMNLAGQALIGRGRYWDAYHWYERQVANYPNGAFFERALDREYLIADAFLNGRRRRALKILRVSAREDGIDILMRISAHAPGSDLAERSLLRVADYYYGRAQYPEAIDTYDEFVKTNPQSTRRAYAMLRAARAALLSYRGVKWDDTPLLNATVRFRVLEKAFPAVGQKEKVPEILAKIQDTLAHKIYHSGTFYQRTKHPQAAAFYFRKVIREYPASQWAQQARGKLEYLGPVTVMPRQPAKRIKRKKTKTARTPAIPRRNRPTRVVGEKPQFVPRKTKSTNAQQKQKPVAVDQNRDKKTSKSPSPVRLEELAN